MHSFQRAGAILARERADSPLAGKGGRVPEVGKHAGRSTCLRLMVRSSRPVQWRSSELSPATPNPHPPQENFLSSGQARAKPSMPTSVICEAKPPQSITGHQVTSSDKVGHQSMPHPRYAQPWRRPEIGTWHVSCMGQLALSQRHDAGTQQQ